VERDGKGYNSDRPVTLNAFKAVGMGKDGKDAPATPDVCVPARGKAIRTPCRLRWEQEYGFTNIMTFLCAHRAVVEFNP
jgi:hypothetical protein